jgi:hypothetical protein
VLRSHEARSDLSLKGLFVTRLRLGPMQGACQIRCVLIIDHDRRVRRGLSDLLTTETDVESARLRAAPGRRSSTSAANGPTWPAGRAAPRPRPRAQPPPETAHPRAARRRAHHRHITARPGTTIRCRRIPRKRRQSPPHPPSPASSRPAEPTNPAPAMTWLIWLRRFFASLLQVSQPGRFEFYWLMALPPFTIWGTLWRIRVLRSPGVLHERHRPAHRVTGERHHDRRGDQRGQQVPEVELAHGNHLLPSPPPSAFHRPGSGGQCPGRQDLRRPERAVGP